MIIEVIGTIPKVPTELEPALVLEVPVNSNAVVYQVMTKNFNSTRFACTSDSSVWFPAPFPILFQQGADRRLRMVVFINDEVVKIPEIVGSDYVVRIGAVRQPSTL